MNLDLKQKIYLKLKKTLTNLVNAKKRPTKNKKGFSLCLKKKQL